MFSNFLREKKKGNSNIFFHNWKVLTVTTMRLHVWVMLHCRKKKLVFSHFRGFLGVFPLKQITLRIERLLSETHIETDRQRSFVTPWQFFWYSLFWWCYENIHTISGFIFWKCLFFFFGPMIWAHAKYEWWVRGYCMSDTSICGKVFLTCLLFLFF